jgi:hypothetical protein
MLKLGWDLENPGAYVSWSLSKFSITVGSKGKPLIRAHTFSCPLQCVVVKVVGVLFSSLALLLRACGSFSQA